jgi:hypothetical protein
MKKILCVKFAFAAVMLMAVSITPAQAGVIDTIVPGVQQYRDLSLEHVYFQNGSAGLQVGDAFVGFVQLNKNVTTGAVMNNTSYVVFSQVITSISGQTVTFGATPSGTMINGVNVSLNGILGTSFSNNTLFAVYDRLQGNPYLADLTVTPLAMSTNLNFIKTNSTAVGGAPTVTGVLNAGDFLSATVAGAFTPATVTDTLLNSTPQGITFGSFTGGTSVGINNTSFSFAKDRVGTDGKLHQIAITNGSLGGANDYNNYLLWGHPGDQDNASFVFNAVASGVPEPASIVLLGIGGLGAMGLYRSRRRNG